MFVESGVFGYNETDGKCLIESEICLRCFNPREAHYDGPCVDTYYIIYFKVCEMRGMGFSEIEHYFFKKCLYRTAKVELLF